MLKASKSLRFSVWRFIIVVTQPVGEVPDHWPMLCDVSYSPEVSSILCVWWLAFVVSSWDVHLVSTMHKPLLVPPCRDDAAELQARIRRFSTVPLVGSSGASPWNVLCASRHGLGYTCDLPTDITVSCLAKTHVSRSSGRSILLLK